MVRLLPWSLTWKVKARLNWKKHQSSGFPSNFQLPSESKGVNLVHSFWNLTLSLKFLDLRFSHTVGKPCNSVMAHAATPSYPERSHWLARRTQWTHVTLRNVTKLITKPLPGGWRLSSPTTAGLLPPGTFEKRWQEIQPSLHIRARAGFPPPTPKGEHPLLLNIEFPPPCAA